MKSLVLIDFDGTLYKKDSLLEFTKFYKGNFKFFIGIIYLSPILVLMKLKLISNENAKIKYFTHFFKDENYIDFLEKGKEFSEVKISKHLNTKLLNLIIKYYENGDKIYIVTASLSEWIRDWSKKYSIQIISTELEVISNKITGNFTSKNCNGIEKVNRIKQEINLEEYTNIYVYGNGKGDLEMLKLAK